MFMFFFNDTATTEIYTLSLHDALPILFDGKVNKISLYAGQTAIIKDSAGMNQLKFIVSPQKANANLKKSGDRKSTRLNSSHANISYAVFCLKKKNRLSLEDNYYQE